MDILIFFIIVPVFSYILPCYWKNKKNLSYWLGVPLGIFASIIIGGVIASQVAQDDNISLIVVIIIFGLLFLYLVKHSKIKEEKTTPLEKEIKALKSFSRTPIENVKPTSRRVKSTKSTSIRSEIQFCYTDADGNFTFRNVVVSSIDGEYLKGFDLERRASRTFKIERIDNEIIDVSTGEVLSKRDWIIRNLN